MKKEDITSVNEQLGPSMDKLMFLSQIFRCVDDLSVLELSGFIGMSTLLNEIADDILNVALKIDEQLNALDEPLPELLDRGGREGIIEKILRIPQEKLGGITCVVNHIYDGGEWKWYPVSNNSES